MKPIQRQVLPIPDKPYTGFLAYDAKDPDSHFSPSSTCGRPDGAPNVLIVLIDDVGFGASTVFGGPCQAPTAERIAKDGLRYTRFHTTALCSPTRAALLSGRNHHTVGMGGITEIATAAPGYNSLRPNSMAPLAEVLSSTAIARRSSENVTKCRYGKRRRSVRSTAGPPARASSTSTASSPARPTSGIPRFTKARKRRAAEDARRGLSLHGGHDG